MKVLLLVDIQRDFCPGGALAVAEGDKVVEPVNELMTRGGYDLVVATKDCHPANLRSFAANNPGTQVFEVIDLHGTPQCLWPVHCVAGTVGAEFQPDLRHDLINHIVCKGGDCEVDSYSGFFDNDHRSSTGLHEYLMERAAMLGLLGPEEVEIHVAGLALDYCVKFTALDGARLGYRVGIVLDACRAVNLNAGDELQALDELQEQGVMLVRSAELLETKREASREAGIARAA